MDYQYIGTISKTHGIQGECFLSDIDALPNLQSGTRIRLGFSDAFATDYILESCKSYKMGAILKVKGVDSIGAAEELRELGLFVERALLRSEDIARFSSSMVGMTVYDEESGRILGTVQDVWQTPAHRTLVIEATDEREVLVPFVPSIVKEVSAERKHIVLQPPEGMFDAVHDDESLSEEA